MLDPPMSPSPIFTVTEYELHVTPGRESLGFGYGHTRYLARSFSGKVSVNP